MRTLQGWREYRGLSREDLAQKAGIPVEAIERWEEVGFDVKPGSYLGDQLMNRVMNALDAGEGMSFEYVPDSPEPGDFIITPAAGAESLIEEILEHSEELSVRTFVPDDRGGRLVSVKDISEEDEAAISEHFDRESRHAGRMLGRIESLMQMLGGDTGAWKDGVSAGERLREMDKELSDELDRRGGEGG